jgi:hypothetical protein
MIPLSLHVYLSLRVSTTSHRHGQGKDKRRGSVPVPSIAIFPKNSKKTVTHYEEQLTRICLAQPGGTAA